MHAWFGLHLIALGLNGIIFYFLRKTLSFNELLVYSINGNTVKESIGCLLKMKDVLKFW